MRHIVLRFLGLVLAFVITTKIVPGITIDGGWTSVALVALVWSLILLVVRPILGFFALPITILTLGIFSLILNALLFWGMTLIIPAFMVSDFTAAFLGSIVLSFVTWVLSTLID